MIDPEKLDAMQTDEQLAHGPDAVARAHVHAMRLRLRTAIPGLVQSFNPTTQTAVVQIAIQKLFLGQEDAEAWKAIPPCGDVPVFFPGGGDYVMTFNPVAGDECLLVFSDRAIDGWFKSGGVQQPTEYRLHDLSDGFAFVGFSSEPRAISSLTAGVLELRRRDGSVHLRVTGSGVELNGNAAAVARVGDTTKLTLSAVDVNALATALLATTAFLPSGNPPAYVAPPVPLLGGEITSGSSTVVAG